MFRLDRDRRQLRGEVLQAAGVEASGGLSSVPVHLGDLGSHQAEEELNFLLVESEERLIKEIGEALDRMERGKFGRCESCGRDIARERLQVLPQSRYCIRCARELESGGVPCEGYA
jgi:RNA polymerase-binding transcription factor DksA